MGLHNLPPVYNSFFARQAIQQAIHACLDQEQCRLVILVGLGGVGKTRLATTVARDRLHCYPNGVWLVDLADLALDDLTAVRRAHASDALAVAIATTLKMPWKGEESSVAQLLAHLQDRAALLLLDSFECWAEDADLLQHILHCCPDVHLLVTSRRAPRIQAGCIFVLRGLSYPASDAEVGSCDAVDLFAARRSQQQWQALSGEDRRAIGQICRMVEGLPLAIELAAGLTRDATPREIANKLGSGFDILATTLRDVPPRHRSLRALFETAWCRLPADLQLCLVRLAVCEGEFTAATAWRVAEAKPEQLAALRSQSLLVYDKSGGVYRLHPVVRAYAAAKHFARN